MRSDPTRPDLERNMGLLVFAQWLKENKERYPA